MGNKISLSETSKKMCLCESHMLRGGHTWLVRSQNNFFLKKTILNPKKNNKLYKILCLPPLVASRLYPPPWWQPPNQIRGLGASPCGLATPFCSALLRKRWRGWSKIRSLPSSVKASAPVRAKRPCWDARRCEIVIGAARAVQSAATFFAPNDLRSGFFFESA